MNIVYLLPTKWDYEYTTIFDIFCLRCLKSFLSLALFMLVGVLFPRRVCDCALIRRNIVLFGAFFRWIQKNECDSFHNVSHSFRGFS